MELKNDTAEQLFIVRQTLYKRIERLESIFGADFFTSATSTKH
ncbi:helix-turn-helix domain-containing protein [Lysinibacillus sp. MHQ-1]|nr:helix-turn-helix domain-containing protein [Lysinibacillus sp. MHQ-1]